MGGTCLGGSSQLQPKFFRKLIVTTPFPVIIELPIFGGRGSNLMQIYGNLDGCPLNAWYYAMPPCFCSTFFEFFGPLWQSNHRCVRSWEIEIVVTWPEGVEELNGDNGGGWF